MTDRVSDTTELLVSWAHGDQQALEALVPRVYRELRRTAANFMKSERQGHTLQATAVVHEVYLRLIDVQGVDWQGRAHFFAICSQLMRRILVDAARKRLRPSMAAACFAWNSTRTPFRSKIRTRVWSP